MIDDAVASVALYWLGILCTVTALYRTLYQIDQLLTGNAAAAAFFWVGLYFFILWALTKGVILYLTESGLSHDSDDDRPARRGR